MNFFFHKIFCNVHCFSCSVEVLVDLKDSVTQLVRVFQERDRRRRPRSSRPVSAARPDAAPAEAAFHDANAYSSANNASSSSSPGVIKYGSDRGGSTYQSPEPARGVRNTVPVASVRKTDRQPEPRRLERTPEPVDSVKSEPVAPVPQPRTRRPLTSRVSGIDRRKEVEEDDSEETHSFEPSTAPADKVPLPASRANTRAAPTTTKVHFIFHCKFFRHASERLAFTHAVRLCAKIGSDN